MKTRNRLAALVLAGIVVVGMAGCDFGGLGSSDEPPVRDSLAVIFPVVEQKAAEKATEQKLADIAAYRRDVKLALVEKWRAVSEVTDNIPVYSVRNRFAIADMMNKAFSKLNAIRKLAERDIDEVCKEMDDIKTECFAKIDALPTFEDERALAREGLGERERVPWDRVKVAAVRRRVYDGHYPPDDAKYCEDPNVADDRTDIFIEYTLENVLNSDLQDVLCLGFFAIDNSDVEYGEYWVQAAAMSRPGSYWGLNYLSDTTFLGGCYYVDYQLQNDIRYNGIDEDQFPDKYFFAKAGEQSDRVFIPNETLESKLRFLEDPDIKE